jgi:hypothetical protein
MGCSAEMGSLRISAPAKSQPSAADISRRLFRGRNLDPYPRSDNRRLQDRQVRLRRGVLRRRRAGTASAIPLKRNGLPLDKRFLIAPHWRLRKVKRCRQTCTYLKFRIWMSRLIQASAQPRHANYQKAVVSVWKSLSGHRRRYLFGPLAIDYHLDIDYQIIQLLHEALTSTPRCDCVTSGSREKCRRHASARSRRLSLGNRAPKRRTQAALAEEISHDEPLHWSFVFAPSRGGRAFSGLCCRLRRVRRASSLMRRASAVTPKTRKTPLSHIV